MKINDIYSTPPDGNINNSNNAKRAQKTGETEAVKPASADGAAGAPAKGSDQIDISGLANVLRSALEDSPERLAKLEKLAKQFESGNYNPDPAAVSQKLVEEQLRSLEISPKPPKG